MKPARDTFRAIARRMMEGEVHGPLDATGCARGAERIVGALNARLSRLVGRDGFRALLARSRVLAMAEQPVLDAVEVKPDGALGGLAEALAGSSAVDACDAAAVLLAHFLEVLGAFVGEDLAVHLVCDRAASPADAAAGAPADESGARGPGSEER